MFMLPASVPFCENLIINYLSNNILQFVSFFISKFFFQCLQRLELIYYLCCESKMGF